MLAHLKIRASIVNVWFQSGCLSLARKKSPRLNLGVSSKALQIFSFCGNLSPLLYLLFVQDCCLHKLRLPADPKENSDIATKFSSNKSQTPLSNHFSSANIRLTVFHLVVLHLTKEYNIYLKSNNCLSSCQENTVLKVWNQHKMSVDFNQTHSLPTWL